MKFEKPTFAESIGVLIGASLFWSVYIAVHILGLLIAVWLAKFALGLNMSILQMVAMAASIKIVEILCIPSPKKNS